MTNDDQFTYCLQCETAISLSASTCPHCGEKNTQGVPRTMGCLGIFLLLAALGLFYDGQLWGGGILTAVVALLYAAVWILSKNNEKKVAEIKAKKHLAASE